MSLCFDIGANEGLKTEILVKHFDKVIAFEPNPVLSQKLKTKFVNSNVIIDDRAVSNVSGVQKFMISDYHYISTLSEKWTTNSRFSNGYKWETIVEVNTASIEEIIDEYGEPEFIKIDVEGHEKVILLNLNKLYQNTIFSFEFLEEDWFDIKLILNHLNSIGYENFTYTFTDNIVMDKNLSWYSYKNFPLEDFINPNDKEKWGMIYFKK